MKVGYSIKLNKIILVGILIAALVISSGCAEDSTSADNSEVPAPAEASGAVDANEGVESAELTLTVGLAEK